jgi:hypothetical protein
MHCFWLIVGTTKNPCGRHCSDSASSGDDIVGEPFVGTPPNYNCCKTTTTTRTTEFNADMPTTLVSFIAGEQQQHSLK